MNSPSPEATAALQGLGTDSRSAETRAGGLRGRAAATIVGSRGVLVRIGLLFIALCLMKLVLIFSFRKALFEMHWRFGGEPYDWINVACFYAFAILVALHVWRLGTRCLAAGTRAVRVGNICVLILGSGFILLTLHEGHRNYLMPIMQSLLDWKSLGWYLAMDFCFRVPYLAAWILGYALVYYVLARTGKEHLILRVTALCSGFYTAFCLRDLMACRNALVVADTVGIACLLASWRVGRPLGWAWIGVFMLGLLSTFVLFYGLDSRLTLGHVNGEFVVLSGAGIVLVGGVSLLARRFGLMGGWSWIVPFALSAMFLFFNVNYGMAPVYQKVIYEGLTFSRYFLGEFVLAALLCGLALGYRRWFPTGSLLWLDGVIVFLLALALADLRLGQIMGVRLDWQALSVGLGETPRMMWRMARPYMASLVLVLGVIIGVYGAVLAAVRQGAEGFQLPGPRQALAGARFLVIVFVLLGVVGGLLLERDKAEGESAFMLAETSPLWRQAVDPAMGRNTFVKQARMLGMNQLLKPALPPERPARDLNVVLIFQESTYNKYLSLFDGTEDTQPLLSRYKDRMEVFPDFFSSFASSINSRFATFTGLYPVQNYKSFTEHRVGVRSIFEVLHDHGYTCSLFYSSFLDYTGFRDFLRGRKLDAVYDADTMPGQRKTKPVSWGLREEETLGAIRSQIKRYAAGGQKFFLTYVPAAPHHPFDGTPARFRKFKMGAMGDYTPLYLNELRYMDWIISSILDQLKESGLLDKTLVVITDDHGEMLGADGGPIGHGWVVTPELVNIPLIIMDPGKPGYHVNDTIGSQVDLMPTILDLLGIQVPRDQLYQGNSLYSLKPGADRTIFLSSLQQYGILRGRDLICGDRKAAGSGENQVFAIRNQGARTLFVARPPETVSNGSISAFDKFQASLLDHYSAYCRLMRPEMAKK